MSKFTISYEKTGHSLKVFDNELGTSEHIDLSAADSSFASNGHLQASRVNTPNGNGISAQVFYYVD